MLIFIGLFRLSSLYKYEKLHWYSSVLRRVYGHTHGLRSTLPAVRVYSLDRWHELKRSIKIHNNLILITRRSLTRHEQISSINNLLVSHHDVFSDLAADVERFMALH